MVGSEVRKKDYQETNTNTVYCEDEKHKKAHLFTFPPLKSVQLEFVLQFEVVYCILPSRTWASILLRQFLYIPFDGVGLYWHNSNRTSCS